MFSSSRRMVVLVLALGLVAIAVAGCTAGAERFDAKPAGFWAGLWHGLLCVIAFVVGLFTDSVRMYETNNAGGWYDFGFLLGAAMSLGGGVVKYHKGRSWCAKRTRERDWEEIAAKVEEKVRRGIREWADEAEDGDREKSGEWEEVGRKIEEKIKRELRDWAEK